MAAVSPVHMTAAMQFYVGGVIAGGAAILIAFAPREIPDPGLAAGFLAAMVVVSLFKQRLPLWPGESTVTMAYGVDCAVMLTAGVDLAMAIAAVGVVVQCLARVRRPQQWHRTAFSVATVVLGVQAAGWVWSHLGGGATDAHVVTMILPLVPAGAAYVAINAGLVAVAITLSYRASSSRISARSTSSAPATT